MLWISPSILAAATTITQHGITWTFDKDYPAGQFVTGERVKGANVPTLFIQNTWDEYREQCGLVWMPSNASAVSP